MERIVLQLCSTLEIKLQTYEKLFKNKEQTEQCQQVQCRQISTLLVLYTSQGNNNHIIILQQEQQQQQSTVNTHKYESKGEICITLLFDMQSSFCFF